MHMKVLIQPVPDTASKEYARFPCKLHLENLLASSQLYRCYRVYHKENSEPVSATPILRTLTMTDQSRGYTGRSRGDKESAEPVSATQAGASIAGPLHSCIRRTEDRDGKALNTLDYRGLLQGKSSIFFKIKSKSVLKLFAPKSLLSRETNSWAPE